MFELEFKLFFSKDSDSLLTNDRAQLFKQFLVFLNSNWRNVSKTRFVSSIASNPRNQYGKYVLRAFYEDGRRCRSLDQYYSKSSSFRPQYNRLFKSKIASKMTLNDETQITSDKFRSTIVHLCRICFRFSIILDSWRLDCSLVQTIPVESKNGRENFDRVGACVKKAFPSWLSSKTSFETLSKHLTSLYAETDFPWKVEFELEYTDENLSKDVQRSGSYLHRIREYIRSADQTLEPLRLIKQLSTVSNNLYFSQQFDVLGSLIRNRAPFHSVSLKKMINQAHTLTKSSWSSLAQKIKEKPIFVTDKADGERCICFITNFAVIFVCSESKTFKFDNDLFEVGRFADSVVLDCELIQVKNQVRALAFDIIQFKEKGKPAENCSDLPFFARLQRLEKLRPVLKKVSTSFFAVSCKNYTQLSENYLKEISATYRQKLEYPIDGLIFTFDPDKIDRSRRPKVAYLQTVNLKWKEAKFNSIDFYLRKVAQDQYILCSAMDFSIRKMTLSRNKFISPEIVHLMNSLQWTENCGPFIPSMNPSAAIFKSKLDLDKKVCELVFDPAKNAWNFLRERPDRKGTFGNYITIAEQTFCQVHDPFLMSDFKKVQTGYFQQSANPEYELVRKYNSFVKRELFGRCSIGLRNFTVLDVSCGKGQDYMHLRQSKMGCYVGMDADANALSELCRRKYLHPHKGSYKQTIAVLADLTKDSETLHTEMVQKQMIFPKANVVLFNFAIHHFLKWKQDLDNVISVIENNMQFGSKLLVTCMDGNALFKEMSENGQKLSFGKKYAFELKAKSLKMFGSKMKIKLPFAEELREEYLVDTDKLDEYMSKKFTLVQKGNFTEVGAKFKNLTSMNEHDLRFVKFYTYRIYKLNAKKSASASSNTKVKAIRRAGELLVGVKKVKQRKTFDSRGDEVIV